MQEEITRLVQGLDDSALRFIEACVPPTNVKPATRPRARPRPRRIPAANSPSRKMSGT